MRRLTSSNERGVIVPDTLPCEHLPVGADDARNDRRRRARRQARGAYRRDRDSEHAVGGGDGRGSHVSNAWPVRVVAGLPGRCVW